MEDQQIDPGDFVTAGEEAIYFVYKDETSELKGIVVACGTKNPEIGYTSAMASHTGRWLAFTTPEDWERMKYFPKKGNKKGNLVHRQALGKYSALCIRRHDDDDEPITLTGNDAGAIGVGFLTRNDVYEETDDPYETSTE